MALAPFIYFRAIATQVVDDASLAVDGDQIRLDRRASVDVETMNDHLKGVEKTIDERQRSRRHLQFTRAALPALMGGGCRFKFCFSRLRSRFCLSR